MAKIYLKIALMFVLTFVWCIGVCGADAIMESGHWFVLIIAYCIVRMGLQEWQNGRCSRLV
jgi:hypothetical protein